MLYLLYGQDDVTLRETLASMKSEVGPAELRDVNIKVISAPDLTFGRLTSICSTVPFMADKRMLIVEGLLSQFEPHTRSRSGAPAGSTRQTALQEWEGLTDYLTSMPPSTELVLVDGRLSASNPLLTKIRPMADVRSFPLPSGGDLRRWIAVRATNQGAEIEPKAVNTLAEASGGNLRMIDMELQKLALYRWGQRIRHEDVQELVANAREANIFVAVDAVVEGRPGVAIESIHQILDSGRQATYVITMIARQVRFLLLAKELKAQGVPPAEMGKRLSLTGYPLRKTLDQERKLTWQRLTEIHHKLLEADLSIKTTGVDEQLELDLMIAQLATLNPRRR